MLKGGQCLENRLKLPEIVRRESSPALNEDKSKLKETEREKKKRKGKMSHFQVSNSLFLKSSNFHNYEMRHL